MRQLGPSKKDLSAFGDIVMPADAQQVKAYIAQNCE